MLFPTASWHMTTLRYLTFADINAPLRLVGGETLLDLIGSILPGWPFEVSEIEPSKPPFFIIDVESGGETFKCQDRTIDGAGTRTLNAVNAVCDMVAAMSRALPATQPTLICLHAAAIELSGRLIVIPNARRSGKSTLAASLAHLDCPVFSDDFLAVSFDGEGRLVGRANGICPRLRLPLHESMAPEFAAWSLDVPGPSNNQYKYLSLDDLPPSGTTLPLGAIVLIDRSEDGATAFADVSPDDAMTVLLRQNFTRDIHSVGVLRVMERLLATLPLTKLHYSNAQDAAASILDRFGTWPTPVATSNAHAGLEFDRAAVSEPLHGAILPDTEYCQKPGAAAATIGDAVFISDPEGAGIHRLNAISEAIWLLLADPITPSQIVEILQVANPDVPGADIQSDANNFLTALARAGLLKQKTG